MFWYVLNTLSRFTLSLETVEKIVLKHVQHYYSTRGSSETEGGGLEQGQSKLAHFFLLMVAADCCAVVETVVGGECRVFMREFCEKNCDEKQEKLSELVTNLNYLAQREEVKKLSDERKNRLKWALSSAEKLSQVCCHVFDEFHSRTCQEVVIRLPFTFLLESVAGRKVAVRNGEISAVCGDSHQILTAVYKAFVELELELLKGCSPLREAIYHWEDDRLRQLIRRLTNLFTGRTPQNALGSVRACDVDHLVQYFPPCMANLHQILRKKHRLSYESRYQYTLFLKDIGMPVNENILFWETEYKKPFCESSCTHDWTEKRYRYKYQIEHMYGLIGSRDAKTSYPCSKFTGGLLSKMDGGCPFRHMTVENLRNSIPAKMMEVTDVEDIFKCQERDMPQSACSVYLSCQRSVFIKRRRGRFSDENPPSRTCLSHVISPLQYFNMARNITQN